MDGDSRMKWDVHYGISFGAATFQSFGHVEVDAENCIDAMEIASQQKPKIKDYDLIALKKVQPTTEDDESGGTEGGPYCRHPKYPPGGGSD